MKKVFIVLSIFMVTQGFGTIVDRLEKIEREMDQYKELQELDVSEKKKTSFNQKNKWCYLDVYPEFLLMQIKSNKKEKGLIFIGDCLGKDWRDDSEQKSGSLPWHWGYRLNGSLSFFSSYDISGSFLRYHLDNEENNLAVETMDDFININKFSIRESTLCLGHKNNWFDLIEFKRILGVKKISTYTDQEGSLNTNDYLARTITRFRGMGPMAGFQLRMNVLGGMHMQGLLAGSILYGKENSFRYFQLKSGFPVTPLNSTSSTLIPSFEFNLNAGWNLVDEKSFFVIF